jgi:hypothetical protein
MAAMTTTVHDIPLAVFDTLLSYLAMYVTETGNRRRGEADVTTNHIMTVFRPNLEDGAYARASTDTASRCAAPPLPPHPLSLSLSRAPQSTKTSTGKR